MEQPKGSGAAASGTHRATCLQDASVGTRVLAGRAHKRVRAGVCMQSAKVRGNAHVCMPRGCVWGVHGLQAAPRHVCAPHNTTSGCRALHGAPLRFPMRCSLGGTELCVHTSLGALAPGATRSPGWVGSCCMGTPARCC